MTLHFLRFTPDLFIPNEKGKIELQILKRISKDDEAYLYVR